MAGGTRAAAAILLAAALPAAGCCSLVRAPARGNRDTPEAAFAWVRDAFAEDRTGDQYDSYHQDFREARGLTPGAYELARGFAPGLFSRASALLGAAEMVGSPERGAAPVATARGPRPWARVTIRTPEGTGVFLLVDEAVWRLSTSDEEMGEIAGPAGDVGRAVRVEGDEVVVEFRTRTRHPPLPGSEVRRFAIHHDWQLYAVERLDGFEEFLGEVRDAAAEASREPPPPEGGEGRGAGPADGGKGGRP